MNESKFTSGPWSVGDSGEGLWWVAGPDHNENVICDIVPRGKLNEPNDEDLANARLIAAAPILYAALRDMSCRWTLVRECSMENGMCDRCLALTLANGIKGR